MDLTYSLWSRRRDRSKLKYKMKYQTSYHTQFSWDTKTKTSNSYLYDYSMNKAVKRVARRNLERATTEEEWRGKATETSQYGD